MFTDIIDRSNSLYISENISESFRELHYDQQRLLEEWSNDLLISNLSSNITILTESVETENKYRIGRLIEFFKKMITKIKDWIDNRLKLTERRIQKLVKIIKKHDATNIEVETYTNINDFDSILDKVIRASKEVREINLTELIEVEKKKFIFKGKAIKAGYQVLRGTFMEGYVNSFKKYNNMELSKIKDDVLGKRTTRRNINVDKFVQNITKARKFKDELDKFSSKYSMILSTAEKTILVAGTSGIISDDNRTLLIKVLNVVTSFFNRNINLLSALTVEIINETMAVAAKMATFKGKSLLMNIIEKESGKINNIVN